MWGTLKTRCFFLEKCKPSLHYYTALALLGAGIKAFILDTDTRRHNTKGQRAMRVAMMYPEPEKGGRGKKVNSLKITEFRQVNTGSQKAMAYAMMFPNPERGKRNDLLADSNKFTTRAEQVSISRARFILKHDPEKAALVRDGHPARLKADRQSL